MSNPDLPRVQPTLEVDEASGRDMVTHAQRAVTTFADLMANVADDIRRGDMDGLIKLGFDYGVSLAYVEVDLQAITSRMMGSAPPEVEAILDTVTVDYGAYRMPANDGDPAAPMPRAAYASAPVSHVRLYLHSTGV